MKKIYFIILGIILSCASIGFVFAGDAPKVNCYGLPGCVDENVSAPGEANIKDNIPLDLAGNLISQMIQYVAVIAVLALMMSGILYLVSAGDEEKVKKAKNWVIWSLAGVLLSISAWSIINIVNNFKIPSIS